MCRYRNRRKVKKELKRDRERMKIQCDVCDKEEASVFCSSDEAALCDGCDRHVHYANKLATKHLRFSLLHPNFKDSTRCDICQDKSAFIFCKEDRSLLCRDCDIQIHKSNEHTQKHSRFLLTGVKLSASSSVYQTSSSSNGYSGNYDQNETETEVKSFVSNNIIYDEGASNISSNNSISDYLKETLPGWQWNIEDSLGPSYSPNGFCKTHDFMFSFVDHDLESVKDKR